MGLKIRPSIQTCRKPDILQNSKGRHQVKELVDIADVLAAKRGSRTLIGGAIGKNFVLDFKRDVAIIKLNQTRERVQQGRLA